MRISRTWKFALALAAATAASSAGAVETVTTISAQQITTPQTWCDDETTIFLPAPVFVESKLTILPGCIIRGNPRTQAFAVGTPTVGSPGTLIVSAGGFIDAQGTPANPIIMTTAAIDVNNDGVADDCNGAAVGICPWDNDPTHFYDDDPKNNPLAGLDTAGNQNASIWGGFVMLGRAPINNGNDTQAGYGKRFIEGLQFTPGYPAVGGRYGGYQPHDSSGIVRYVSVRYAGDEIGNGNELNGITLGGVGDATIVENVEVLFNSDDGIEIFGGTVDVRNAVIAYVGDDSLDIDQGYTGSVQNVLITQLFFREDDNGVIGTVNGDAIGEFDGHDCGEFNCNIQIDQISLVSPPTPVGTQGLAWPNAHPGLYNMTSIGTTNAGATNPAVTPFTGPRGLRLRRGFTSLIANSITTNVNANACNIDADAINTIQLGLAGEEVQMIKIVSSTFSNNNGAFNCTAGTTAGDALVTAGRFDGGSANALGVAAEILVNDNTYFLPKGVTAASRGRLAGSKVGGALDPRPANPGDANVSGGIKPRGRGLDASATYRGAFPAGQPLWTTGWTALSKAGILANN
ncbi:hypothetical protein K2X89_04415 [Myxococcota bacterium]|nr:hypothetical protein [Myxococcota bacterium]